MTNYEVPLGKTIKGDGGIGYNEFVVYNTNQLKLKYLLKVKVN